MRKIPVGILGATGLVGQVYLSLLKNHPFFTPVFLAASKKSAGKRFGDIYHEKKTLLGDKPLGTRSLEATIGDLSLYDALPIYSVEEYEKALPCRIIFSALPSSLAHHDLEYAKRGAYVIAHASSHRNGEDIPLIIPEVNASHLCLLKQQKEKRNWKGGLIAKPNCTLQTFLLPLTPLLPHLDIESLYVTSMQAMSGAGYQGLCEPMEGNVLTFIEGEEEKVATEPHKIWGSATEKKPGEAMGEGIKKGSGVRRGDFPISVHCNRVPVPVGHTCSISVRLKGAKRQRLLENLLFFEKELKGKILSLWSSFRGLPQELSLPTAPEHPLHYLPEFNSDSGDSLGKELMRGPEPTKDLMQDRGMGVTIGRLRSCPTGGVRFIALSHNLIRGAAGGGLLTAELLYRQGYVERDSIIK